MADMYVDLMYGIDPIFLVCENIHEPASIGQHPSQPRVYIYVSTAEPSVNNIKSDIYHINITYQVVIMVASSHISSASSPWPMANEGSLAFQSHILLSVSGPGRNSPCIPSGMYPSPGPIRPTQVMIYQMIYKWWADSQTAVLGNGQGRNIISLGNIS